MSPRIPQEFLELWPVALLAHCGQIWKITLNFPLVLIFRHSGFITTKHCGVSILSWKRKKIHWSGFEPRGTPERGGMVPITVWLVTLLCNPPKPKLSEMMYSDRVVMQVKILLLQCWHTEKCEKLVSELIWYKVCDQVASRSLLLLKILNAVIGFWPMRIK